MFVSFLQDTQMVKKDFRNNASFSMTVSIKDIFEERFSDGNGSK